MHQVLKLLRKHGLVEGAKRTGGPGRTTNPEAAAGTAAARRRNADGDADADAAAANGRGRVPEPNAGKVLACLQVRAPSGRGAGGGRGVARQPKAAVAAPYHHTCRVTTGQQHRQQHGWMDG